MICEVDSRGYTKAIREYKHKHRHDSKPWMDNNGVCFLCGVTAYMSKHHLIPQSIWLNKNEMAFVSGDDDLPLDGERTVDICWVCHNDIHHSVSNEALARFLNTPEKLLAWKANRWSIPSTMRREPTRKFVINEKGRSYKLYY